jgi:PAS domain S-box-containing protein
MTEDRMSTQEHSKPDRELATMRERLMELEETLNAIRSGQVDALVHGNSIFTLESAESASNRFRGQVLQQISETVIAVDNEGLITYLNEAAEEQYGRSAMEVLGLPLTALYRYTWADPAEEQVARKAIRAHGHWRGEHLHVKLDGEVLHVESVVNVLRDAEGERIGLLAVMRDITERVRDREALAESARQKDHFLATLAHELRNPLAPLMNGLQLLHDDALDTDMLSATQGMMQRQLDHLVRLVDDLMDLSRISRGKLELRKEDLDLSQVLNMAIETSKPLIERSGHQLNVEVGSGPFPVHGDATRLAQIISNLLNNAAKYTPYGGVITVELSLHPQDVVLRISDTGLGIAPDQLHRIFDMFTQVDATEHGAGGLGIGLSLSQRLAQMHDGQLDAQSGGKNKGSSFTLHLPVSERTPSQPEAPAPALRSDEKWRVLAVDDNEDVATTTALVLRKLGQQARSVFSGAQALECGADLKPHLVLMDLGMPGMSGHEACARMRSTSWGSDIMIVAISGWGQDSDRARSRDAGFDEHLVKPLELHTIQRLLGKLAARTKSPSDG